MDPTSQIDVALRHKALRRIAIASAIEWYDFFLYGVLAANWTAPWCSRSSTAPPGGEVISAPTRRSAFPPGC